MKRNGVGSLTAPVLMLRQYVGPRTQRPCFCLFKWPLLYSWVHAVPSHQTVSNSSEYHQETQAAYSAFFIFVSNWEAEIPLLKQKKPPPIIHHHSYLTCAELFSRQTLAYLSQWQTYSNQEYPVLVELSHLWVQLFKERCCYNHLTAAGIPF